MVTTLRIPEEKTEQIKQKANEIGISQNAFINVLIDLGLKVYDADIKIVSQFQHQD